MPTSDLQIDWDKCPVHSTAIKRYVQDRVYPGSGLYAILSNDLTNTIGRCDTGVLEHLVELVQFIYCNIPASCWGSKQKCDKHLTGESTDVIS